MTFDVDFIIDTLALGVLSNMLFAILHNVFIKIVKLVHKNNRHE